MEVIYSSSSHTNKLMKLKWKSIGLKKGLERHIPDEPGVYVIKSVERYLGLPVKHDVVYVGKSENLRRRYREHSNFAKEHNAELLKRRLNDPLEFWYAIAQRGKIAFFEKELISNLNPTVNKVRYVNHGEKLDD